MDWNIITQISTGFSLVAFISACITWLVSKHFKHLENFVAAADEEEKLTTVNSVLDRVSVKTDNMSNVAKERLAMETLGLRRERYRLTSAVIIAVAAMSTLVACVALFNGGQVVPTNEGHPMNGWRKHAVEMISSDADIEARIKNDAIEAISFVYNEKKVWNDRNHLLSLATSSIVRNFINDLKRTNMSPEIFWEDFLSKANNVAITPVPKEICELVLGGLEEYKEKTKTMGVSDVKKIDESINLINSKLSISTNHCSEQTLVFNNL